MLSRIFTAALILNLLIPSAGFPAGSLDIFDTKTPFTKQPLGKHSYVHDLGEIAEPELAEALNAFRQSLKTAQTREERNLLYLGTGFLHGRLQDYSSAIRDLDAKIIGNFILEDFRLHFKTIALKEWGAQEIAAENFSEAIALLKKALENQNLIFQAYPDSPFHGKVSRKLAEIEKLLGDGYFALSKYKAAWKYYRRAMMRDFPENGAHQMATGFSLAKTYAKAGSSQDAANVYINLLRTRGNPAIRDSAQQFLIDQRGQLKKAQITALEILLSPAPTKAKPKLTAKKTATASTYKNQAVQAFYDSLGREDALASIVLGADVLNQVPGVQEAQGVIAKMNRLIVNYLTENDPSEKIVRAVEFYPEKVLNQLALALWKKDLSSKAAIFYKQILEKYPLDIPSCHKALFFLGRIEEDQRNFSKALDHYNLLIEKYDSGPYTPAAFFKIAWVERLQGHLKQAAAHFQQLIDFDSSLAFTQLKKFHPGANSFIEPAQFWLAQTEGALGEKKEKEIRLRQLIENHPFGFYSIVAREELGVDLKGLVHGEQTLKKLHRAPGLGDMQRKRLSRAERLIAIGFFEYAAEELAQVTVGSDNPAFIFYLSRLHNSAKSFQGAIRLSWKTSRFYANNALPKGISIGLFPKAYLEKVRGIAEESGLDPLLILALMRQESAFNAKITSRANAVGLMQLLPGTAAGVAKEQERSRPSIEDLKDPHTNILLGIGYFKQIHIQTGGNIVHTLIAYNAGPSKVKDWAPLRTHLTPLEFIESIPYKETRGYVKKVLSNYSVYQALYGKGPRKSLKELLTNPGD